VSEDWYYSALITYDPLCVSSVLVGHTILLVHTGKGSEVAVRQRPDPCAPRAVQDALREAAATATPQAVSRRQAWTQTSLSGDNVVSRSSLPSAEDLWALKSRVAELDTQLQVGEEDVVCMTLLRHGDTGVSSIRSARVLSPPLLCSTPPLSPTTLPKVPVSRASGRL
jgi:hypothetical protein